MHENRNSILRIILRLITPKIEEKAIIQKAPPLVALVLLAFNLKARRTGFRVLRHLRTAGLALDSPPNAYAEARPDSQDDQESDHEASTLQPPRVLVPLLYVLTETSAESPLLVPARLTVRQAYARLAGANRK